MLVIDTTASHCDICLESYSQTSSPHALPCGHVFCQSCIENVQNSQGIIAQDEVDWAAVANNPFVSANDLPRLAPCPLCRSSFTRNRTYRLQATYSSNLVQLNTTGDMVSRPESTSVMENMIDVNRPDDISTQAAIKMHLEIQISDIIFEGMGSASRNDIVALNHQVQEWLADEALEGRVEEHVLLRASIQLLMQSLRSR